jgi:nitrogen fixation protein FixH|tara:strand:+ start:41 stop:286 length:246 start_codon:yes stop_codon:yes gene_type:complete
MANKETVKQEESSVTINDTEIKESEMTEQQKYFASQVQEARAKRMQLQRQMDRNTAVINSFESALIETTKKVAEEILSEEK